MEKCKYKNPKCTCKPCNCEPPCTCGLDEYEKTTIENMMLDLQAARKQAEENLNLAKYQKAEFENYKKRERGSFETAFNEGRAFAIMNVLPILDALTEAMKMTKNENREGLEILQRKFEGILTSFGVTEITAKTGDKFDPYIHNSVATGKSEKQPPSTILEIWQKGYKLDGRVLRATSVKVNN